MPTVLVTNVNQYAGPGVVTVLLGQGCRLLCHDAAFADEGLRERYEADHAGAICLRATTPEEIAAEAATLAGAPDAIVSNDVHPITQNPIEAIPLEDLRATFEAVVLFPIRLVQLFLPAMKARGSGSLVLITSTRERRPEPGFAVPTTLRAATTAFAKALAIEAAPFDIQVNTVGPNYLASELYYPDSRFGPGTEGAAEIARIVPAGRLGRPEEVGELVAFLASGRSPFTTGQFIGFTGGWA